MKKKILMIDIGGWGGITHYTYNLIKSLSALNEYDLYLLTDSAYELSFLPQYCKVILEPLSGKPYARAVKRIVSVIMEVKPSVIHVQTMNTARKDWFLFLLASISGFRIVLTAHNIMPHEAFEQKAFFMKQAFGIIYNCVSRIIVHSEYSRNKLTGMFGIAPRKIYVIAHGNYGFFKTRQISMEQARKTLNIQNTLS